MKDERSPEHKAVRAGIETLTQTLPGCMESYIPGEFHENPYIAENYGGTLYQAESQYATAQGDGTSVRYDIQVRVVKWVDSHDTYWERQLADRKDAVVIDGKHYRIGEERGPGEGFLGFGGRRFDIEFLDGRETVTHNLWYQGPIPPKFLPRLPDNARWAQEGFEGPFGKRKVQ